jgi:predicted phage terminase large subunit-like protein
VQCTSVGASNAGKVRANKFLLVDDLIGSIEQALNINILNKLWNSYSVDARQRMMDGCKEIIIATRWSVHDPIGRLERLYANSDSTKRTRFIAVPDIDPVTNESNFMFSVNGLSKEFFESQALVMDEISYRCLYKQDPIEREGLLYHEDELRRFTDLPLREPDSVVGICDTKNTGTDFMVMPIFYVYDEDYYLVDVVCDNGTDFNVLYTRMVDMIIEHKVQAIEFESNQGGRAITTQIRNMLNERHWVCNITEKPTETNKEARIIANSYQVKKMILFKDKNLIQAKSDYSVMMDQLLSYTQLGKNKHDDVPDCLANFILYATRKTTHKAAVIRKNFW